MNSRSHEGSGENRRLTLALDLDVELIADLEVADQELARLRGGGKTTLTTQNTDRCASLTSGT